MSKIAGIVGVIAGTIITLGGFNLCIYGADTNWTVLLIGSGVLGLVVALFLACVNWRQDPVKETFAAMLAMAGIYLAFAGGASLAGYVDFPHPLALFERAVAMSFCGAVAGQCGIVAREFAARYLETLALTKLSWLRLSRFAAAYTTGGAVMFGGILLSNRIAGTPNNIPHCLAAGLIAVTAVLCVHFARFKAATRRSRIAEGVCVSLLIVAVLFLLDRHSDGRIIGAPIALASIATAVVAGLAGRAVLELLSPKAA